MVNRNAYREGPKALTRAGMVSDLPENRCKRIDVKGQPILLLRRGNKIYAIGAPCLHFGGPLEKGKLEGDVVECPCHYSGFSLFDGRVKRGPSTSPVPDYYVQVVNGQAQIKLRDWPHTARSLV